MIVRINLIVGVILTVVLTGCSFPHPGYPGGDLVGHVGVSGADVAINGMPARNGAAVREGDRVTTGTASSAILEYYNGGGKLQLDANSAARFRKERVAPGLCSLVDFARGQAWILADAGCGVELRALDYVTRIGGRAAVTLRDEGFEIAVLRGTAHMIAPQALQLNAGQRFSDAVAPASVQSIDKNQLEAELAWTQGYRFQGWCCFGRNVMPGAPTHCPPPEFSFDEATLTMQCKHKDGPFSWMSRFSGRRK